MSKCIFCDIKKIICENADWVAMYDEFPLTEGHTLIIPKKHISSFFEIGSTELKDSFFDILLTVKEILNENYKPLGYNIGINDGFHAGQTIPHLHVHVIPRYVNDGGLPCGVRNIFGQEKANYLKK